MIRFTTSIQKFGEQGEKTGWSYILIPAHLAQELKPGNKKSFRVKGKLDAYPIKMASLIPMGEGDFILAINAAMRKGTRKREGGMLQVILEVDTNEILMPEDFTKWLNEEASAKNYFYSIPKSHQNYWINWINEVKGEQTRINRLTRAVTALSQGFGFAEMLRAERANRLS